MIEILSDDDASCGSGCSGGVSENPAFERDDASTKTALKSNSMPTISQFFSGCKMKSVSKKTHHHLSSQGASKCRTLLESLKILPIPPNRPSCARSVPKVKSGRNINYDWFFAYPWASLTETNSLVCSICSTCVDKLNLRMHLEKRNADAFITVGISDFKHAPEKLHKHDGSNSHKRCMEMHLRLYSNHQSIRSQLDRKLMDQQRKNRKQLLIIYECIATCTKQNLVFRNKVKERGNLHQLVQLVNKFCPARNTLPTDFLSPQIMNELISMMAKEVRESLISTFKSNKYFGLIADEGTTCDNKTMVAVCIRTCNTKLQTMERFIGAYKIKDLKAETIKEKLIVSYAHA